MPVKGDKAVARALREISRAITPPIRVASVFALRPTLAQTKANIRGLHFEDSTGALEESMVIRPSPRSPKLNPIYQVGPNAQYQSGDRRPVRYAHLIEFGTAPHYQPGRGVVHPGTRPMPFLEPAYFTTRDIVVKRFGEKIGPEMEKRAAKLAAKQTKASS